MKKNGKKAYENRKSLITRECLNIASKNAFHDYSTKNLMPRFQVTSHSLNTMQFHAIFHFQ